MLLSEFACYIADILVYIFGLQNLLGSDESE